ncbi:MAG: ATP-binding protein [Acidobacteriota bacterium]
MIKKVSITNFKSHAHTEIELGKVTALVGPNGSGKSTVLQTIYALNQLIHRITKQGSWNWEVLNTLVRKRQYEWSVCIASDNPDWQIKAEKPLVSIPKIVWTLNQAILEDNDVSGQQAIAESFGQSVYFKGIANHLSSPSSTLNIPPRLSQDGSGLASVLADLMTSDRRRHQQIEKALCDIVPTVKEVNAQTVNVKLKEKKVFSFNGAQFPIEDEHDVPGKELIFNTASGDRISASAMSDGTLLTLGLLTILYSSQDDTQLFLLDDIEQGLHPLAQRQLMTTLKEFAENHGKQIILTSHSPYIVDELDAKDVWVMATNQEGISHCKRLSDHPDATRLLEVLTTGELEGAVGEDWVLPNKALAEEVNA